MNSPQATIILKSPDGAWTSVGTETSRGIVPEGITVSANEFGPDTCSFSLRRESSMTWPDLLAFNQADVLIGGTLVWGGRIWEAPVSDGDEDVIAVQGRGWQYHLDDDMVQSFYVHTNLGDYADQRSKASAQLANFRTAGATQAGPGVLTLGWPSGFSVVVGDTVGVTFDIGAALGKRAVVTFVRNGVADGNTLLISRASNSENSFTAGDDTSISLASASGSISHTFSVLRRYHHVFLYRQAGPVVFGSDQGVVISPIRIFGDTAYEAADVSILRAGDVFTNVLASGALPLLDPSTAAITSVGTAIPEFAPAGFQTPRALMAAANAYEGNIFGVDAERKVFFRDRDTYPRVECGGWTGSSFQDASTNSGEDLYNRVIVQGTGPDGVPIFESRSATSGLLNRQGFTRTAVLSVESAITPAGAQALGDVWLSERTVPALKGSLVLQGWGGARDLNGGDVHPSEMLLRYGQLIRLGQLVDPATGDQGRDGIIKAVSYQHDTETASVELDSERGRLETLLSRLAVVTGQIR